MKYLLFTFELKYEWVILLGKCNGLVTEKIM